eukprot:2022290-Rhodomonas_salina.1
MSSAPQDPAQAGQATCQGSTSLGGPHSEGGRAGGKTGELTGNHPPTSGLALEECELQTRVSSRLERIWQVCSQAVQWIRWTTGTPVDRGQGSLTPSRPGRIGKDD